MRSSLMDRLNRGIKGDSKSARNKTDSGSPLSEQPRQSRDKNTKVEPNRIISELKTEELRDSNTRKLTSVIMQPDRLNKPTIISGSVGDLYTLYKSRDTIKNQYMKVYKETTAAINNIKREIPLLRDGHMDKFKKEENRERRRHEEVVARLNHAVAEQSKIMKDDLKDTITRIKKDYNDLYDKNIEDTGSYLRAVTTLIENFQIPRRGLKIPDDLNINSLSPAEIYGLVEENANLIEQLESVDVKISSEKDIEKMFEGRSSQLGTAGLISLGAILVPITFSAGIFSLGKKLMTVSKIKKLVKTLEDEILLSERILYLILKSLSDNYQEPDTKPLEDQMNLVDEEVYGIYKNRMDEAEIKFKEFMDGASARNKAMVRNMNIDIDNKKAEQSRLEQKLLVLQEDSNAKEKSAIEAYSIKLKEFQDNQLTIDFGDKTLITMLNESGDLIKDIRTVEEYNLLSTLEYNPIPKEGEDDPSALARCEYDAYLLDYKEDLNKRVRELEKQGLTLELLKERKDKLDRELDVYYKMDTSDIADGYLYTSKEIIETMKVYQTSAHKLKNRSILFVYDSPDEEDMLIDYIKFLTQQTLSLYHPSSVVVNIISRARSNKFNNLQISLDKFNQKTQELEKGDPYCTVYSDPIEINEIYNEQLSNISRMNSEDLIDKTFDEMVLHRRKIGGIVPKYHINIIYNEEFNHEIIQMSKESSENGLTNYVLVPKSQLYTVDPKEGKLVVDKTAKEQMNNFELVAEIKNLNKYPLIYLTDYRGNSITRLAYTERPKEEIVKIGGILKDRVFDIKSKSTFTLVKEYIDDVTKGEYWTKSANKTVELHFGYVEGDKSRPYPIIMNEDDSVHMFMGGTTGGGKSNILGVVVNSLKMMYPPSELDVYYFDFKVVEVAIHTKPYKMPHCSAMTGTSSAEYLISLLRYIFAEMENRYSLIEQWGVQKLSELQTAMRKKEKEERDAGNIQEADRIFKEMPRRTVIVVDEVAQGFKHPDQNVVEVIKDILTKLGELARAAGMHMLLVSQEPGKIPPTLLDLCKIRGCTKATPGVSKAVVGNNMCGKLENQFMGFFGTNNANGDERANRRYVVPLNGNEPTKILSKIAYQMSENDLNRDAVVFNDREVYTHDALKRYLNGLNVKVDELMDNVEAREEARKHLKGNNFFLGEPAYFYPKFQPLQMEFEKADMQNLAIVTTNPLDVKTHFELIYQQLAPYSDCIPVYCKSIPDYAPVEMFHKNNKDNTLFCPMFAKNIIDEKEVYEVTKETVINEAGEEVLQVKNKQIYKYNVYQVVSGDIFTRPLDRDDVIANDYYSKNLIRYLSTLVKLRKSEPDKYYKRPMYLFAFDFTGHSSIAVNSFPWRELMSVINDANSCGVHLITFSSTLTALDSRNIFSKVIVGSLMADEQFQNYKGVPTGFNKLVDKQNSENNRTYKVAKKMVS